MTACVTIVRFGTMDVVHFDHAEGVFVVGGTEKNQAFKVSDRFIL